MIELSVFIGGLILLIVLIFKGRSLIVFVPIILFGIIVLSGEGRQLFLYARAYVSGMMAFISTNALLFFLGVLMGAYTAQSGMAQALAERLVTWLGTKRTVLALVVLVSVLTFGGISGFVVIFTVYPIIDQAFQRLGIPKRFVFGVIGVGMASHMIGAMPGTLQIQNIIPTTYLNTDLYAGAALGLVMTLYLFVSGQTYLSWRIRRATRFNVPVSAPVVPLEAHQRLKGLFVPLFVVLLSNFVFSRWLVPYVELGQASRALYALNGALILGILSILLVARRPLKHGQIFKSSALTTLKPLLFVGSTVGFGTALSLLPFLVDIKSSVYALDPTVALPLTVALFSAISGSATGGLSIAYPFLGDGFIMQSRTLGIADSTLHRLSVMASVTLDTLPTNGTTMTMLKVTGLDYKTVYFDYFVLTVLNTSIALMLGIFLTRIGFG